MSKQDFLKVPPSQVPTAYVAGLGRGATGFTTRSDIGPAKEGPSEDQVKAALLQKSQDEDEDERFKDAENEVGLLGTRSYDAEDAEADRIYERVDQRIESRRKAKREAREKQEMEEYERRHPKAQHQFADLKRPLASVTDEEWAALPEPGDMTGKNRRMKNEMQKRTYAVPDSIIASARNSLQYQTSIDTKDEPDGTRTDFNQIGYARDKLFNMNLQRVSDSVSGTTNVDPKGYLTSMGNSVIKSEGEVEDIKRARVLLHSVTKSNPKNAAGWVGLARLEEVAGNIVDARKAIADGCEHCPEHEDVWLENMRLNEPRNAKIIAAKAVKHVPQSVKIWIEAMRLETEVRAKKKVLRKGLDINPRSVALWKEAINLESNPDDAKILLASAVEMVPLSVTLWLALARLESYDNARKVLNRARKAVKTSYEIWLAAARLQEQHGDDAGVDTVIKRAVGELESAGSGLAREQWLAEAEKCETEDALITCRAIIRHTLAIGVDEYDQQPVWLDDAKAAIGRGKYGTARAIYSVATSTFPREIAVWRAAADLERVHGTAESIESLLKEAVQNCPQAAGLWLMAAKEKWSGGDIAGARSILGQAFEHNPNNEDIWLAAVKLEADHDEPDRARTLLSRARVEAGTERVWIRSVNLERQLDRPENALALVSQGLQIHPASSKLWMMKGQVLEAERKIPLAREAYTTGTKAAPKSPMLWVLAARLEESCGAVVKARSILDRARLANPKNAEIWLEAVRLEKRQGNLNAARNIVSKALQECPTSGRLHVESIWMEPRTKRRTLFVDAIQKAEGKPTIIASIARTLWSERKFDKAKVWFERAIKADPDYGDSWAHMYHFVQKQGTEDQCAELVSQCIAAEPHHGEIWTQVSKDTRNWKLKTEEILQRVTDRMADGA